MKKSPRSHVTGVNLTLFVNSQFLLERVQVTSAADIVLSLILKVLYFFPSGSQHSNGHSGANSNLSGIAKLGGLANPIG